MYPSFNTATSYIRLPGLFFLVKYRRILEDNIGMLSHECTHFFYDERVRKEYTPEMDLILATLVANHVKIGLGLHKDIVEGNFNLFEFESIIKKELKEFRSDIVSNHEGNQEAYTIGLWLTYKIAKYPFETREKIIKCIAERKDDEGIVLSSIGISVKEIVDSVVLKSKFAKNLRRKLKRGDTSIIPT